MKRAIACLLLLLLPDLAFAADSPPRLLPAGNFGTVTVYIPTGAPQSVAIFLSGDGGWNLGVVNMAQALRARGAVVIGVDVTHYLAALRGTAACRSIAGDFENLSHRVQKKIGLKEYHVPVLLGYSSGATVVYAVLMQSSPGTFAGAMSLGFCPDQDFGGASLCPGTGLHLGLADPAGAGKPRQQARAVHLRARRAGQHMSKPAGAAREARAGWHWTSFRRRVCPRARAEDPDVRAQLQADDITRPTRAKTADSCSRARRMG